MPPAPVGMRPRLLLGIVLAVVGFNMRPALTCLGPLLPEITRGAGLNALGVSLLTSIPVACMGLAAPVAPVLARLLRMERAIVAAMAALAVGAALRWLALPVPLFAGSVIAGLAIGVANVLLPALVKRDAPDRMALMMGLYTVGLTLGSAVASATAVPLMLVTGGWAPALAIWALPALVAAVLVAARPAVAGPARVAGAALRPIWRHGLAWQVTLFMGTQSAMTYTIFAWMAPLLRDRGFDAVGAGLLASVGTATQIISAFVAPRLATRGRDQRGAAIAGLGLILAGFLTCLYAPPGWVFLGAVVMGLGQGGAFAVALIIIVLRAADAGTAARLSGMAQTVGYVLACVGPLGLGLIRQHGDWLMPGVMMAAMTVFGMAIGWQAGRARSLQG